MRYHDHALKVEDIIPAVRLNTLDKIASIIETFLLDLGLPSERLQEVFCRSCDGFIPFSHNKGGYEITGYTDLACVMGSGYLSGSDSFNDLLHNYYEQNEKSALEEMGLTSFDQINEENQERFWELSDEYNRGDYNSIQVMVRGMYTGFEETTRTHSLNLDVFLSVSDAPYHRSSDASLENTINFRTTGELQKKLDKIKDQVIDFIGGLELY